MLFTQSTFYLEMLKVSETVWCNETHSSIALLWHVPGCFVFLHQFIIS